MKYRTEILLLAGLLARGCPARGAAPPVPDQTPVAAVPHGQAVVRRPEALLPPPELLPPAAHLPRLRMQTDPVRREHAQLRRHMQLRTLSAASDRRKAPGDKEPDARGLRVVSGNTAGNWSPYPDRALDARTLRFPMRRKNR